MKPLRPSLYRLAADGGSLMLLTAACPACERLTFPAGAPGCAHCGSDLNAALVIELPATGTLLELVTVHVPLLPGLEAPLVVGDIAITGGPVVEGVLAAQTEEGLAPGMAVEGIAVPCENEGTYTCRFVPAAQGRSA